MNWENEREQYIEMLEKVSKTMGELSLSKLSLEKQTTFQQLILQATILKEKLSSGEFEIAIVGLEKAGKSTLANALIESDIFPSASDRCTYTQTELRYGQDIATIEFYTKLEFENIVRSMLEEVEFPMKDIKNVMLIPASKFASHFKMLETTNPSLYKKHHGKTEYDLMESLEGKITIERYLNESVLEMNDLSTENFKKFITDKHQSRSVKKITIYSSKLKDMRSTVIFDVPGFDSPTGVHEQQTLERLKKSDGIILVTNVGITPNLVKTQLRILTNEVDEDGISLNDKLFIFGNRMDAANFKEDAYKNRDVLISDAVYQYKIAKLHRVFTGSAYAYLAERKIVNDLDAVNKLDTWGIDTGIEALKAELTNYYRTERFMVLKKRVDHIINEVKELSRQIVGEYNLETDGYYVSSIDAMKAMELWANAEKKISFALHNLRDRLREQLPQEKSFTHNFISFVDEKLVEITKVELEKMRITHQRGHGKSTPAENVNQEQRKYLYSCLIKEQNHMIKLVAEKLTDILREEVRTIFLHAIFEDATNPHKEEVSGEIESFIDYHTHIAFQPISFVHLIERFTSDIIELLVLCPVGSTERKNKFFESERDFYMLAMYDEENILSKPAHMQPLIAKILSQNKQEKQSVQQVKAGLVESLKKAPFVFEELQTDELSLNTTSEKILQEEIPFEEFAEVLEPVLETITRESAVSMREVAMGRIETTIKNLTMLTTYDSDNRQSFIPKILSQNKRKGETFEQIEEQLAKALEKTPLIFRELKKDPTLLNSIAHLIVHREIPFEELATPLETILAEMNRESINSMKERVVESIESTIKIFKTSHSHNKKENYLERIFNHGHRSATLDDVLNEINTDIRILQEILKGTVLQAMSLEKSFLSMMNKQLIMLVEALHDEQFQRLISKNVAKINYLEYEEAEKQQIEVQQKKQMVGKLNVLLNV